MSRISQSTNNH